MLVGESLDRAQPEMIITAAIEVTRAATKLLMSSLDLLEAAARRGSGGPCQHHPGRRIDLSTMGTHRWQCLDCNYIQERSTT